MSSQPMSDEERRDLWCESHPCRTCDGAGEVRHHMWGMRNCPEPTEPCPACQPAPIRPRGMRSFR